MYTYMYAYIMTYKIYAFSTYMYYKHSRSIKYWGCSVFIFLKSYFILSISVQVKCQITL